MGGMRPPAGQPSQVPADAQKGAQAPGTGPQIGFQNAMQELRAHPAQMLKQAGYNVPDNIANDPQASVMHLIQSGQVSGPMMQRIRPMLNMLMGGR